MTEAITAISTVGFPIVMCLLLLYMQREQNTQHKTEMEKMTDALNNNTKILVSLQELLEVSLPTPNKEKEG